MHQFEVKRLQGVVSPAWGAPGCRDEFRALCERDGLMIDERFVWD
jgi:hypothetical protein